MINQPNVRAGLIAGPESAAPEQRRRDDAPVVPSGGLRDGSQAVGPLGEGPAETGEQRIQEDTSTVITFRDSAMPFSPSAPTATATQPPAGEAAIPGVSADLILEPLKKTHKAAFGLPSPLRLNDLRQELRAGDVVLTLGAGDVWKLGEQLLAKVEV